MTVAHGDPVSVPRSYVSKGKVAKAKDKALEEVPQEPIQSIQLNQKRVTNYLIRSLTCEYMITLCLATQGFLM